LKQILSKLKLRIILLSALIVRLLLSPWIYHDDVITNYWWGKFAVDFPLRGYYDWLNFGGYVKPDQPMLYILFYRTVRILYLFFYNIFWYLNINISLFPSKFMQWYFLHGNQVMEKLPIIFCDLIFIYCIYFFILKEFSKSKALLAALILAFYPPMIYNSAVWGSNDSFLNFLGLTAIYFMYKRHYIIGSVLFTLCLLFKSSLIIIFPIILVILYKNKVNLLNIFKLLTPSFILFYIFALPFSTYNPILWLINTYFQKILPGAMSQLTSNAMNFWAILYGLSPKNDNIQLFNLISARNLSLIICTILSIFVLYKLISTYNTRQILLTIVTISLIVFIFLTRMHERYTFPALLPLLLLCFYEKSYIKYFIILSITHLLNVYNWWWIPSFPLLISILKLDYIIRLISFINLTLTFGLIFKNAQNTA
jgi:dolichyl-phosphate-mannose-protein mannosyltransferase